MAEGPLFQRRAACTRGGALHTVLRQAPRKKRIRHPPCMQTLGEAKWLQNNPPDLVPTEDRGTRGRWPSGAARGSDDVFCCTGEGWFGFLSTTQHHPSMHSQPCATSSTS
jgi:hypothetical protein